MLDKLKDLVPYRYKHRTLELLIQSGFYYYYLTNCTAFYRRFLGENPDFYRRHHPYRPPVPRA